MKILIGDNYPLSRLGLVRLIDKNFPGYTYQAVDLAEDVMKFLKKEPFDLIILAFSHPGRNAMEILQKIKVKYPDTPVLIICIYPEELYGLRALKIGASGYISRESPETEVVKAIEKIISSGVYISPTLAENMAGKLSKNFHKQTHELLSDRELQILQFMASGKTARTISRETSLSVNTISTYRSRILSKLGMKSNADITRFAIENALI
jgi:two-component system invasion response regulator UvrY